MVTQPPVEPEYPTPVSAVAAASAYTDWLDGVLSSLADYADRKAPHYVHLHGFAEELLDEVPGGRDWENIISACIDVVHAFGWVDSWSPSFILKTKQIEELRSKRARWEALAATPVTDRQRHLLHAVVRNSVAQAQSSMRTEYVDVETTLDDPDLEAILPDLDVDLAIEELDELAALGLCWPHKTLGLIEYRATYRGTTWVSKAHVLADRDIDELWTQGEHDHLDYKRLYKLSSPTDKAEFARDVLSFANTGGGPSRLLVGVENDGSFTAPDDPAQHARLLGKLEDTTLQAIVSERTVSAPSILVSRGDHSEGPYVLITVTPDVRNLPYRFFSNPVDSKLPGASQAGEVWVRHGTSKRRATADEVTRLEERARTRRALFP